MFSALCLACDAVSLGKRFPTYRRNVLPSSRIKRSQKTVRPSRSRHYDLSKRREPLTQLKTRSLFALNALHFLTDCSCYLVKKYSVLESSCVVGWLAAWLIAWLVGCLVRNDWYGIASGAT
jgi:hypothetical protein